VTQELVGALDAALDGPASGAAAAEGAVVVRLGGTRYGIPMESVAEVGRMPRLTRVPGVPDWMAGVANFRGRILPVVDLRPLLDAAQVSPGTAARLLVLSKDGTGLGLLTEGVEGTAEIDPDSIVPPPGTLSAEATALLAGQITDRRGPLALLDVTAVFRLRDRLPRARRTA
jgi:chemotaxis signal transduction protein